jgi:serine/threonine-protein kinase RsbT
MDFAAAGDVAAQIKRAMTQIGMDSDVVRRTAIATFEAEMNVVIHAFEGIITATITSEGVEITADDSGPGIPDVELAMQEGFTTAPPHIREMGFGAGMGLPNIRNCSDEFQLDTEVGKGTCLRFLIRPRRPEGC